MCICICIYILYIYIFIYLNRKHVRKNQWLSYHSHRMPQLSNPISLLFGCLQVRHLCTPTFRVSLFQHCHCNHYTCMPRHATPSLLCACQKNCTLLQSHLTTLFMESGLHRCTVAKPLPNAYNVCQAAIFVSRADCWRSGPGVWHGQLRWGHKASGQKTRIKFKVQEGQDFQLKSLT